MIRLPNRDAKVSISTGQAGVAFSIPASKWTMTLTRQVLRTLAHSQKT